MLTAKISNSESEERPPIQLCIDASPVASTEGQYATGLSDVGPPEAIVPLERSQQRLKFKRYS